MEGDGDDADEESEYWVIFACQIVLGSSKTHSHSSHNDVDYIRKKPPTNIHTNQRFFNLISPLPTNILPSNQYDVPARHPSSNPLTNATTSSQIPESPNPHVSQHGGQCQYQYPSASASPLSPAFSTHSPASSKQASEPSFSSTGLTVPGDVISVSH